MLWKYEYEMWKNDQNNINTAFGRVRRLNETTFKI
jgi:hypothetical protein